MTFENKIDYPYTVNSFNYRPIVLRLNVIRGPELRLPRSSKFSLEIDVPSN